MAGTLPVTMTQQEITEKIRRFRDERLGPLRFTWSQGLLGNTLRDWTRHMRTGW